MLEPCDEWFALCVRTFFPPRSPLSRSRTDKTEIFVLHLIVYIWQGRFALAYVRLSPVINDAVVAALAFSFPLVN